MCEGSPAKMELNQGTEPLKVSGPQASLEDSQVQFAEDSQVHYVEDSQVF